MSERAPRTDAFYENEWDGSGQESKEFAQKLERELATATEQLRLANVNAWDMERQREVALQQRDEIQEEYVRMRGERDELRAELDRINALITVRTNP